MRKKKKPESKFVRIYVDLTNYGGEQKIGLVVEHNYMTILKARQPLTDSATKLTYEYDTDYKDASPLVDMLTVATDMMKHIAIDLDAKREETA